LFVSVALSGERKTTVDRAATKPVHRHESRLAEDYEAQLAAYKDDCEAWKAAREHARKIHKSNRPAIRAALEAIGPEPKEPPLPMLLVADFTPPALVLHFQKSRPWCGIFTSEGGELVGGEALNPEREMQTAALLNKLWDGEPIRRLRVIAGNAFLPGRRCSAHVMMQPIVADQLLSDAMLDGIGTLARMLIVVPQSTIGLRPWREPDSSGAQVLAEYNARILALLKKPPQTSPSNASILDPLPLTFTSDARALWISFHDVVERDLGPGGALQPIQAFGAKMAEHAARLAAVLTVYADPEAIEVDADMLECGIRLAQHYASEMLRLAGSAAVSQDLRLAERLLKWWQARPDGRLYLAEIYQRGLNAIGDAATARRIVGILEDHGHAQPLPAGTVLDEKPRREAWELAP
jgi:hypothetical protein